MAKVSVIILTYNRAEMLRLAIASVLNQSFQDLEIIIVDDASEDNTVEVVNSFGRKNIEYIRHKTNKGEAKARNTGLANAKGEYIAFLDDDDEWLREKLGAQVNLLENSSLEVGAVYTGCLCIRKTNNYVEAVKIPEKRGDISQEIFKKNFIIISSILLRKECFEKVGYFDEDMASGPDYDMWIRISKSYQFVYIKEPMVKYYIHEGRLSTNFDLVIKGIETRLEKYREGFGIDPKCHSRHYFKLAVLYCLNGKSKRSRKACSIAIKSYPFAIKCYLLWSFSFLGAKALQNLLRVYLRIKASLIGQENVERLFKQ
jgi:glycosyltransferase involved in cell wall biosynthesis